MSQLREIFRSPLLLRALLLGALTGAALVLVHLFSTRGPLMFLPYAAMFAALAPLLVRYRAETFLARAAAGFAAFLAATLVSYVYVRFVANPGLPQITFIGLARFALVIGLGTVLAVAVAFLVGDDPPKNRVVHGA